MSRNIDWEKPLSEEDRTWASQFAKYDDLIKLNDAQHVGSGAPEGESDDEVEPYEDWKKDALAAEVTKRGLKVAGNASKADLITVLEADDASA